MQVKYEAPPLSVAACLITRPGFKAGLAETVVPMTAPAVAVTFPVVVTDATEISPAVVLTASPWFSAADHTRKTTSPSVMVSVLKGTPLFPIIWRPALETMTGLEIFAALM